MADEGGLLKLSQGYDEGWISIGVAKVPNLAYNRAKFGTLEHVKVDGLANGWIVEGSGEITIFYWPQLLVSQITSYPPAQAGLEAFLMLLRNLMCKVFGVWIIRHDGLDGF